MARWRDVVPPVPAGPRPLWSVMIPAFNRRHYVRIALESVLAQDPGPELMQIEVVDDCSTEPVHAAVAEVGGDRVGYFRQPTNLGNTGNLSTCVLRSRGDLIHLLHSDDVVLPGFYETLGTALTTHPEVGAAFCHYLPIDEAGLRQRPADREQDHPGVLEGWLERIALGQRLQTPCMVVRRSIYERLGSFDQRIHYGEDWEMWVRIAAHYPVWYEPQALALYRVHTNSLTGSALRNGSDVADLRQVTEINRLVLPPDRVDGLTRRARGEIATTAFRRGARAFAAGDSVIARSQWREAFRTSRRPAVLTYAFAHGARACAFRLARTALRRRSSSRRPRSS